VSIGIRYFFEEWHLLRYEVMFGRWALFPEQWLNSAKANILTGFVQLKQTAIDKSIVFVPCHFGGIPWLVLCYECSGTESERERATYRIYRDLSSRVNTATRILGQHSFANELKRLFSITVAGNSAEGGQVRKMVVKEWSKLGFIYPIKPPILRQLTPETPTEKRLYVVRFSDGDWFLDDSEGNNPFVALTRPLAEQEGESWSSSLGDMVKRSLVKSATEELRSGQIQRERDIADAAYAVGHPLKHRFNSLEGELGALCSHVGVKLPSDNYTQELATSVVARLETCKRVATMMNIIASWRQAKTHGQVEEFLISKPYQLFEHLLDSHSIWVHTERRTVAIRSDDLVRLRQTIILPFQTRWGTNGRLVDSFYEEIIFELLLNVARYALSNQRVLSIALDPANPANPVTIFPGLIFSNACNKACKPQDLVQGEWTEWGDGREGGLRFISECLRITGAGSVHVKFEEDGANCVFRVRAGLQGLANTGHEANAT
jgi:hypothetical protein